MKDFDKEEFDKEVDDIFDTIGKINPDMGDDVVEFMEEIRDVVDNKNKLRVIHKTFSQHLDEFNPKELDKFFKKFSRLTTGIEVAIDEIGNNQMEDLKESKRKKMTEEDILKIKGQMAIRDLYPAFKHVFNAIERYIKKNQGDLKSEDERKKVASQIISERKEIKQRQQRHAEFISGYRSDIEKIKNKYEQGDKKPLKKKSSSTFSPTSKKK